MLCCNNWASDRRVRTRDPLAGTPQYNSSKDGIVSVLHRDDTQGKLPLGQHRWQFEIVIPADALPSFSTRFNPDMWLSYFVKAYVDIPHWPGISCFAVRYVVAGGLLATTTTTTSLN
jgi:hypothetical protein